MIDSARNFIGSVSVVVLPAGLLFWFVIHPWAHRWRKLGPSRTYLCVLPVVVTAGVVTFRLRWWLLGVDLGLHWILIAIAGVLYLVSSWMELGYWRQLSIPTLVGVTELSGPAKQAGKMLKEGAYRSVRHPRYLSAGIAVIAGALFVNHAGLYVLILVAFPVGLGMLVYEERDLVNRFGDEYRQYQRDVPKIIPRWR